MTKSNTVCFIKVSYCNGFQLMKKKKLTAFGVCLGVLVKMFNAACVKGAGTPNDTMNLERRPIRHY